MPNMKFCSHRRGTHGRSKLSDTGRKVSVRPDAGRGTLNEDDCRAYLLPSGGATHTIMPMYPHTFPTNVFHPTSTGCKGSATFGLNSVDATTLEDAAVLNAFSEGT